MSEDNDNQEVLVEERKFNGVATFKVDNAPTKDHARSAARQFWREEYGSSPSKIVVETENHPGIHTHTVMVADHSSGSLKNSKKYEL
jgi:hypothetical protein